MGTDPLDPTERSRPMIEVATTVDIKGGLVVGHDGSGAAADAARWAARTAVRLGVPLHVIRTWNLSTAPRPATAARGYVPPLTDFEQAVRDELEADVADLGLPDECEVSCHVLHGAAARRLLEAAAHADLLVVGSRGAGGFRGLLFGSTADQVVRHAPCPVVVVPVAGTDDPAGPDSQLGEARAPG
jgi:nucleotide-binding universal stress UspA family protein